MRAIRKALLFVLAIVFLFETWIWDSFVAFWRWLGRVLPIAPLKALIARLVLRLPPWAALILFIIPAAVVFPFKIGALWLIAHHHVLLGATAFFLAKVAGVGVAAFLFDLTRDKLMSMAWFARLYAWVMGWRDWAHHLVDPYTQAVKAQARALKERLRAMMGQERSPFMRQVLRLRERVRRRAEG